MAGPVWAERCRLTRKEIDRISRDAHPKKIEVMSFDMTGARRNLHKALHVRMDSKWKDEELGDRILASETIVSARNLMTRELEARDKELADPTTDRSQDYVQPRGWGMRGFNGEFAEKRRSEMTEAVQQEEAKTETKAKAKATKAKAKAKPKAEKKADGDGPGRASKFAGKTVKASDAVFDNKKENPRRVGTFGHKSMQIIIDAGKRGIKFEAFIEAGGRAKDLSWDIEKGNAVAE